MKHTVLCVDDEVDNVDALERLFRKKYRVLKATSGEAALRLLDENRVTVIISDQRMPNMSGVEFLERSMETHPFAIRILLTGYTDIDSVISAINTGQIYRYVTKPWDPVDLSNAIDKAVERYELGEELKEKNRALEEALAELRTLDEAKNHFMILVNHELKTPLTSVMSYTELLRETSLNEEQAKFLSRIGGAALKLQDLVTDVLELTSAETGVTKVDLRACAARDLFSPLPDLVMQLASERKLFFDFALQTAAVRVDEKLIRNVILRLLHNAAKFSTPGSTVSVKGVKGSDQYRFSIINPGQQLSEATIRRILKPFSLNEDIMHHSKGLGMGLSVSQAILRRMGSTLEFESKSNVISVSFSLPLAT